MTHYLLDGIAAFLSGILASLGLGGGNILILYLVYVDALPQQEAQLVNLFVFLPISLIASLFYAKKGKLEKKAIRASVPPGLLGAVGGAFLAAAVKPDLLRKLFGIFLILIALKNIKGLFGGKKK